MCPNASQCVSVRPQCVLSASSVRQCVICVLPNLTCASTEKCFFSCFNAFSCLKCKKKFLRLKTANTLSEYVVWGEGTHSPLRMGALYSTFAPNFLSPLVVCIYSKHKQPQQLQREVGQTVIQTVR